MSVLTFEITFISLSIVLALLAIYFKLIGFDFFAGFYTALSGFIFMVTMNFIFY